LCAEVNTNREDIKVPVPSSSWMPILS